MNTATTNSLSLVFATEADLLDLMVKSATTADASREAHRRLNETGWSVVAHGLGWVLLEPSGKPARTGAFTWSAIEAEADAMREGFLRSGLMVETATEPTFTGCAAD